jgi:chromosome segregation ATPase
MKKLPKPTKIIIPLISLIIGLIIGLGVSQIQIDKERKISQDKMKEASKKFAFIQRKMEEEKNQATVSMEERCHSDLDKLQNEKTALGEQLVKLKEQARSVETKMAEDREQARTLAAKMEAEMAKMREQVRTLEARIKQADEVAARTKKELEDERQKYAQAAQRNKDLESEGRKMAAEKQVLQAGLEKATRDLGQCEESNAKLCLIAEELVKAYRNKGIGAVVLEKEPLTQVKRVELEQFTQRYREEIDQQRIKKK